MYTDKFPILGNFIETKLTESCIESDTTLYVADTSNLPDVLTGKDYIPCVLRDSGMTREIVYVTAFDTATNSLTVERGKEGTTPAAWNSGTYFYNTLTAASLQSMRVNSFSPLVDADAGRPVITRTSATTITIPGDWTDKLEVGMAVRVISGDAVVMPVDMELGAIHITSKIFEDGVTEVALQNVNLPATVSGLDLGLSVAAAPLYHPDTIVADEDTLTQEQNVIRISDSFTARFDVVEEEALGAKADTVLAAQNAADVSGGSLSTVDLNQILSAYEMTNAKAGAAQSSAEAAQSSAEAAIAELAAGVVKSVDGELPDGNGNISIVNTIVHLSCPNATSWKCPAGGTWQYAFLELNPNSPHWKGGTTAGGSTITWNETICVAIAVRIA